MKKRAQESPPFDLGQQLNKAATLDLRRELTKKSTDGDSKQGLSSSPTSGLASQPTQQHRREEIPALSATPQQRDFVSSTGQVSAQRRIYEKHETYTYDEAVKQAH